MVDDKDMKSSIFIWIISLFPFALFGLDVHIETPYAVLMDADSGKVLYAKNPYAKISPCSTMKIATILFALENKSINLDEVAVAGPEALKRTSEEEKRTKNYMLPAYYLEPDGTMVYLRSNERLSLRSLIYASMLRSANDACNVLALHLSGEMRTFCDDLNEWLKIKGLCSTHFVNPHGLYHPDHYSCAYDMALLGRAAYHNPIFMEMALQRVYAKPKTNLQKEELWKTNSCILKETDPLFYPKALFAKTGQLKMGKSNLVAAATNGERTLVVALHKSPTWKQRYLDAIQLFEAAFQEEKASRLLFSKVETKFEKEIPKSKKALVAVLKEDVLLEYFPSQEPTVKAELKWNEPLKLPIKKGDQVGSIVVFDESGKEVMASSLFAEDRLSKSHYVGPRLAVMGIFGVLVLGAVSLRLSGKKSK